MKNVLAGLGQKVEALPIDALIEAPNNARIHTEKQVGKLADNIIENGWTNPILVDENNEVLAGHGRLAAARKLSLPTVPVLRITGLTRAKKIAVRVADNRLHDESSFNKRMLKLDLEELVLEGFKLELTGFDTIRVAGTPVAAYYTRRSCPASIHPDRAGRRRAAKPDRRAMGGADADGRCRRGRR